MSGSIWSAVHAVTSVPLAFVANAIVARSLGVADYGSLAFLTIAFGLALQVANGGFSDSLLRNGADAESRGDHQTTNSLLRRSLGFHVLVELPLLWVVALVLARDEPILVITALLVSSAMSCVFGGATLYIALANRGAAGAKLAMVTNAVMQVAVVAAAVVTSDPITVVSARFLSAAALVPLALLAVPRDRRRSLLTLRLPRGMPAGFWKFAGQSSVAGLIAIMVFSRSEILLLGWLSDAQAVGLFALAFGLSVQITAPVDAMLNPMAPAITGLLSAQPDLASRAFLRASRFSSLLCAVITGVLLPVVYFAIPWVYGEDFRRAALLLLPLAAVSCIQSMGQTATAFAFARQQGARLIRVNVIALVVNVGAAVPLIITVGVWGAVIANILGQLASVLALSHGELRLQGIAWSSYLATIRIWPIAVATGAATIVAISQSVHRWWGAPAACFASGLVGFVLVVVGGRLTSSGLDGDDRDAMVDACPRKTRSVARVLTGLFVHHRMEAHKAHEAPGAMAGSHSP